MNKIILDRIRRWRLVGGISREGCVFSLDALWVVPHVSHHGANDTVEGVPRTPPCETTFTLAVESTTSTNAAFSHLLVLFLGLSGFPFKRTLSR